MSDTDSDDDSRSTDSTNERQIELPASVVNPFHYRMYESEENSTMGFGRFNLPDPTTQNVSNENDRSFSEELSYSPRLVL